jgi:hypothetical protein
MKKIKFKFILSIILLLTLAVFAIFFEKILITFKQQIYIVLFIYFVIDSLEVILPIVNQEIHSSKMSKRIFVEVEGYDKEKLSNKIKTSNKDATIILFLYSFGVLFVGFSFLHYEWFTEKYIYLIFLLINFGDYFCLLVWCPFKSIFLKNTCCTSCRITNWDRWMKVSILLFVPNFFTISINIIAIGIFIYWEYNHFKYPERFYRLSNQSLSCSKCNIKKCGKSH